MRSLWAAGLLLRRLRNERGIILLVFVLVAATSSVFAAAPRLFNGVSDDALREAARVAPPSQRNLALSLDASFAPGSMGSVASVRAYGEELAGHFPESVAALISDRLARVTTVRFYVPDPPSYQTHISLRFQDGLTDETRLVSGRWPVDHGQPLHQVPLGSGPEVPDEPVILEVALSAATAADTGIRLGDRLAVTLDGSDPLVRGIAFKLAPTEFAVVGLYEPLDPDAEYWDGDSGLLEAAQVGQVGIDERPIAYVTAYVPAEMYPGLLSGGLPFHYEWRFQVDPQRLDADQVAQLQVDLRRLGFITVSPQVASTGTVVVLTGLPGILDRYATERALSETVLSIAAIGPFGLAGGAMAMVATLLVRRRRATLALARGRGASGALVLGTQLWEAILLAGGASLLGLLIAVSVIPGRASPLSATLALATGGAAILLLVGASWATARRPLGQLERDDQPVLRVAPRRLVIEGTIVFIAVAATLLLRQRGLAVGEAGSVARFDPLLASVPVLSGLAAGIVALRLYPLPIRAFGWVAAQRRDVVPVLGLRTIERHPAAANLPLLVLLLTAAFGAFSSVIASSVNRGQEVASYQAVGADYRVERIGIGALVSSLDPAAVPGVEAVARGIVDDSAAFVSVPNQRARIHLEAVDPSAYATVTAGSPADPRWPIAFLGEPAGTGLGTDANPIPALLSLGLPQGSGHLAVGDTFRVTVAGQWMTFRLVQQRAHFPGIGERQPFAVVPFSWVQAAFGKPLASSVMWLRAPGDVAGRLATTVAEEQESARIVSRYDAYATLHDAPLGAMVATGYALALVIAAVYMALTIIGSVVLTAARQTRDLAYLRTLGVTRRQALSLTVMEHAPPVLLALVPGVALGIGVAILCEPGLGLATFVGSSGGVPLFVDWQALALMAAALVGVVVAAVMAGTWLSRRAALVDVLRIGED
ncbi:MAG: FtsX-like permease family protein [Chloroflexota bacterium]|nr:FtsX-like permease family protein [Chloroflexota bacterium]